jgi:hypothetical protein
MTYLASQLITRSWYLSGIVARNLETVSGDQITDGLYLLNVLLDFKGTDVRLIPYFSYYEFPMVVGQEMYFIPNLYAVETLTFNLGPVRYPMTPCNRVRYFGTGRVDNIVSFPFQYHLERAEGGSNIFIYYLPIQTFPTKLHGKFALTDVTLNTDLTTVYDTFYIEYLRYGLAQLMCNEYGVAFAPEKLAMLKEYEKKLTDVSPPDLNLTKVSFMNDRSQINWAQLNIGRGFTSN